MPHRLKRDFYARDTLIVARHLLGQRLVRRLDGGRVSGRIVEVEAYIGETDQASHARFGPTERNRPMYGPPGHAYVYFIYGMYHCFNMVTEREGYPAAVLVRAVEPLEGLDLMRARRGDVPRVRLTSGPGRLCQAMEIDRGFDGCDLCVPDARLFVEADLSVKREDVSTGSRIGIRGDEAALAAPWRFYLRENPHVSRR